jgi:hypothetical protein
MLKLKESVDKNILKSTLEKAEKEQKELDFERLRHPPPPSMNKHQVLWNSYFN